MGSAFLAYCVELQHRKPVIFCGDLNVAHTELDLANPGPNRGKKGFTDEEREGFQNFVDAGFVDTFRKFKQATATTRGGATSPIPGSAMSGGESTTYWCRSH